MNQNGKNNPHYRHGMSHCRTYNTWHLMKARCNNPNAPDFHRYGARGIKVCKRWNDDFRNFLSDMGKRPKDKTLDRIDNSKDYSPENCRWATKKEQHRNTRQNKFLEFNGEIRAMIEWSEVTGIRYNALKQRISAGWDVHAALTTPVRKTPSRKRKNA